MLSTGHYGRLSIFICIYRDVSADPPSPAWCPPGHPECGRKESAAVRRRAFSILYDILFPIRGEEVLGHHAESRTLFDFYDIKS